MKSRKKLALGAVLFCLGTMSSCFSDDDFIGGNNGNGKYKLIVTCQAEEGEKIFLEKLANGYMKTHKDVQVVTKDFGGRDFDTWMNYYAQAQDKMGHVVWMPDDRFAAYAKGGYFVDLRKHYESDPATAYSNYYETMIDASSYSGEFKPIKENADKKYGIYFAPRDYNKPVLICNMNLFNMIGLELPKDKDGKAISEWDYSQFNSFCKEIIAKKDKASGTARAAKAAYFQFQWEPIYSTFMNASGSDGIVNKDGLFNLDSDVNKALLQKFHKDFTSVKDLFDDNPSNFNNGAIFMRTGIRSTIISAAKYIQNKDGQHAIDFLPLPCGKEKKIAAGCSGYGIVNKNASGVQKVNGVTKTNEELAWDFIKYTITENGQETAGESGGSVPVLKSLADSGCWRNYLPGLNHGSFLSGEEMRLTTYNIYDPRGNQRSSLRNCVGNIFQFVAGSASKIESLNEKLAEQKNAFNATAVVALNWK